MQLYVLDRSKNVLATASSQYNDKHHKELTAGVSSFEFDINKNDEAAQYMVSGNYITTLDDQGRPWSFTILYYDEYQLYKTIYCEDVGIELYNKACDVWYYTESHPFEYYLDLLTDGTPWELGVNQLSNLSRTLNYTGRDTGLGRLLSVLKEFDDAECIFNIQMKGPVPVKYVIDVYKKIGTVQDNIQIAYNEELNDIKKTETRKEFVTALSGVGSVIQNTETDADGTTVDNNKPQEYVNFADLEYDDGSFYTTKGDKLLRARTANAQFNPGDQGYIEDFYEYDTKSSAELFNRTLTQIKTRSQPQFTYEADVKVIDPSLDIGDTVTIIDHDYNPALYLQARVATLDKSYTDTTKGSITFTNYVVLTDTVTQQIAALKSKVNGIKNGSSSYVWIRYADDDQGTGISQSPKDKTYVAILAKVNQPVPSDDPKDYAGRWVRIVGEDGLNGQIGPQGEDGSQGIPGEDGRTSYTHIAYADTAIGGGFSQSSDNKKYIGIYADFEATDSTDVTKYNWSLIKGADGANGKDGIPGKAGTDGKTPYFHIAYADSADGNTNFSLDTPGSRKYIGSYTDFTKADSDNKAIYSWQLVQGPKGDTGADGVAGKDGVGIKSTAIAYQLSSSGTTAPIGTWSATVPTLTKGQYLWTRTTLTYTDNSGELVYSVSYVAKDGNNGTDGVAGKDGVGIKSTTITYQSGTSGTVQPTGTWVASPPSVTGGNYLWTRTVWSYTDGTSETGYSVARAGEKGDKGEKGLQGLQGIDGKDGIEGPKGADGKSSYTHIAYGASNTGAGFTQTPSASTAYIGMYVNQTATDSDDPASYQWTLIKGADGSQGTPGKPGSDGKTPYLHTAYSWSADGTDRFTTVYPGENLYSDTKDINNLDSWYASQYWTKQADKYNGLAVMQTTFDWNGLSQYVKVKTGEVYTFSLYARYTSGTGASNIYWLLNADTESGHATAHVSVSYKQVNLSDNWQRISATTTITSDGYIRPRIERTSNNTNTLQIAGMKPEKGSIVTLYTSPLDDPEGAYPKFIGTYTDYIADDSTDPSKYTWAKMRGEQGPKGDTGVRGLQGLKGDTGIKGPAGMDGKTSYTHIAYANSATGEGLSEQSAGKTYIGVYVDFDIKDSTDATKYKWSLIKGADGANGTPGKAGADGKTPYLHVAYSNSADGVTDFTTDNPDGKKFAYLGTYTDYTQADPTDTTKYLWSLIKGEAGANGKDGQDAYLHIAYANSVDGKTGFTTDKIQAHNRDYLGTYSDNTKAQSTDPTKYTWQLTRGVQGLQGQPGSKDVPVVTMSSTAPSNPKNGDFWYQTTTDASGQKITGFSVYSGGKWVPSKIDQSTLVLTKLVSVEIDSATINSPDITVPFDFFDKVQTEVKGSMEFKDGMLNHISTVNGGGMLKTVISPTGYELDAYKSQSDYTKNNPYASTQLYTDNVILANTEAKKAITFSSSGISATLNNETDQSANINIGWEDVRKYLPEKGQYGTSVALNWFDVMSSVQSHPNLLHNSSLISGTTNWGIGGNAYGTNVTHDGNFAVCLESRGGGNYFFQDLNHIPDAGNKICISFWANIVKHDGGVNGGWLINLNGANQSYVTILGESNPTFKAGWRYYQFDPITVPSGTTGIRFNFYNNDHPGNKIYFAQPMINIGDHSWPYMPTY